MKNVFISHSSKDLDFVFANVKGVFDELGFCAWCSATSVRLASDWEQQIRRALLQADWFVVVLSPDAVKSEWVQAETHWAFENKRGRVLPIMARSCDPADAHLRLGTLQFLDFRADPEAGRRQLGDLLRGHAPRLTTALGRHATAAAPVQEQTTLISKRREARLRLRIECADGTASEHSMQICNWAVIGRATDADLPLADDCVSRKHARIAVVPGDTGNHLTLMDLDSANGTLLNGQGVAADHPLKVGDRIELGDSRLHILAID
jgi:hypothetical protein